jgi:hypothetical protein
MSGSLKSLKNSSSSPYLDKETIQATIDSIQAPIDNFRKKIRDLKTRSYTIDIEQRGRDSTSESFTIQRLIEENNKRKT